MLSLRKKDLSKTHRGGFTLIELLVVIAIITILMTMAAGILKDAGNNRGMQGAVDQLESMLREAQTTAIGNDTYTRLVIADDPGDPRHLRFMTVMMLRRGERSDSKYDGSDLVGGGRWSVTSNGALLPQGVYFSPHYSRPLEWSRDKGAGTLGRDVARLSGKGKSRVYYIEFDEKGRFVAPLADPAHSTQPMRLVLINGKPSKGRFAHDGVEPVKMDARKRPIGAGGVVLFPNGNMIRIRTPDQIVPAKVNADGKGARSSKKKN